MLSLALQEYTLAIRENEELVTRKHARITLLKNALEVCNEMCASSLESDGIIGSSSGSQSNNNEMKDDRSYTPATESTHAKDDFLYL